MKLGIRAKLLFVVNDVYLSFIRSYIYLFILLISKNVHSYLISKLNAHTLRMVIVMLLLDKVFRLNGFILEL